MKQWPKIWLLCAALLSLVISRFAGSIDQYFYDVILMIGINIILAVGLNLVNGYTGQFSLGHAGFMAVGAYTSASITVYLADDVARWAGAGAPPQLALYVFALLMGGVGAAIAGLVVGVPSLRLRGDYLAIATLGFGEIIRVVIQNTEFVGGARGFSIPTSPTDFFWTYLWAAISIYVVLLLVHSTYGRGFLTVRDDEIAAEAMGINTTKYKVIAFVVGAFFAGIAGGLYAHFKQYIHPEGFNFLRSVDIVVIVILGGMGNTLGVIAAAIILTLLPEGLRALAAWDLLPIWIRGIIQNRMILYSLLLIILMLTRPQGLFAGSGRKKKWLAPKEVKKG